MEIKLTSNQIEQLSKSSFKIREATENYESSKKILQREREVHDSIFSLICEVHNLKLAPDVQACIIEDKLVFEDIFIIKEEKI